MEIINFTEIDLEGIKGVILDLDDTLYSYKKAHEVAIASCYESYKDILKGMDVSSFSSKYREARNEITERLKPQASCRSRILAFQIVLENINLPTAFSQALVLENSYWDSLISNAHVFDDALEFLVKCKKENIKTCILTDLTMGIQVQKIRALGLEPYIDFLVTSEEVGEEKPSPKMFEQAIKKLAIHKSEVLMIGDNFEKDIQGAEKNGIKGIKVCKS